MILLIDNYDSFTFNLYQYIGTFTQDIKVVRNDKITIGEIRELHPDKIVLSPGPKSPKEGRNLYGCGKGILQRDSNPWHLPWTSVYR